MKKKQTNNKQTEYHNVRKHWQLTAMHSHICRTFEATWENVVTMATGSARVVFAQAEL